MPTGNSGWGGGNDNSTVDVAIRRFFPPCRTRRLPAGCFSAGGDRGEGGDQLGFDGTGAFEYISDATHDIDKVFNSTHSSNGAMNPWREPAFNNTLGHDANVFVPDNSRFDYLKNNATEAEIRVTTVGESITVQVITSVVDVYEPLDLTSFRWPSIFKHLLVLESASKEMQARLFLDSSSDMKWSPTFANHICNKSISLLLESFLPSASFKKPCY